MTGGGRRAENLAGPALTAVGHNGPTGGNTHMRAGYTDTTASRDAPSPASAGSRPSLWSLCRSWSSIQA